MPAPTSALPTLGSPNSTEDPKVRAALAELQTILTGGVDTSNLAGSVTSALGLSGSGRGKVNIATTETRTNPVYGLMTTPDRVSGIVLPADGLIFVLYQATWQESSSGRAVAGIFIGANQLKAAPAKASQGAAPGVAWEAQTQSSGFVNQDAALTSYAGGLISEVPDAATAYSGDVTTGQIVGLVPAIVGNPAFAGPAVVKAAAGTYDISVQFKASLGSVTVKNRTLWVWTVAF